MPHPSPIPDAVKAVITNPVETRTDLVNLLHALLSPLSSAQSPGGARIRIGHTGAHFDAGAADMEGYARALWGLTPLLALEPERPGFEGMRKGWMNGLVNGTDPDHEEYWGDLIDSDQRMVEMAALGFSLCIAPHVFWDPLNTLQRIKVNKWLLTANEFKFPENNWRYFRVFINLGLKNVGAEYSQKIIEAELNFMESFYAPSGLPADGQQPDCRGYDYYATSFALPFYSLIYSKLCGKDDPERAKKYRQRAQQNLPLAVHLFGTDGAAIPFGRSMTYRFACAAFWGAVAFDELELPAPFTWGVIKGLLLRNIRWFTQKESVFARDGTMTIGWAYPTMFLSEDYNSPQSPYWALKAFLPLSLPDSHPLWAAKEEPYPEALTKEPFYKVPTWGQVFTHARGHDYVLSSGPSIGHYQRADNAKYGKLAYSAQFGFSCSTGSHGVKQLCPDSTLALTDDPKQVFWRMRRDCEEYQVREDGVVYSTWKPWGLSIKRIRVAGDKADKPLDDVLVTTYLVPPSSTNQPYHTRIHRIQSGRGLQSFDGGWAIYSVSGPTETSERRLLPNDVAGKHGRYVSTTGNASAIASKVGMSGVLDLTGGGKAVVEDADGTSNLISSRTLIPGVTTKVEKGETWLASEVWGIPVNGVNGNKEGDWVDEWRSREKKGKRGVQEIVKELGIKL